MKKLSTRNACIILMIFSVALTVVFFLIKPGSDQPETQKPISTDNQISEARIRRICELATLKCYYHNATEWRYSGNMFDPSKRLWMEYDGFVRVGIQGDQVKISKPDENGVITVTIPPAIILEKDLDENTISRIEAGTRYMGFIPIYSEVTSDDRRDALAKAQNEMVEVASRNYATLAEAQERAKKIIQKNIVALGEMEGKEYTVVFIDPSE